MMLDPFAFVQMLLALGVLVLGSIVVGEWPRRKLAPIWWPMLFGFLLRTFAWEPFWGLPGFGALMGTFEAGYTPTGEFILFLGNLGIYLYLFREGLHGTPEPTGRSSRTRYTGFQIWSVAVFGLVAPLGVGLAFCALVLDLDPISPAALLFSVSLTATSIAASAKIIESESRRHSKRGSAASSQALGRLGELRREILQAAVIDDFLGLLMLLMVMSYATGESTDLWAVGQNFAGRTAVVVSMITVGVTLVLIARRFSSIVYPTDLALRHPATQRLMPLSNWSTRGLVALLFLVVAGSEHLRVSGLVAAYLFGYLMHWLSTREDRPQMALLRAEVSQISGLLLPLYFALSGMMVSVELVVEHFGQIALLTGLAIVTKWLGSLFGALFAEVGRLGHDGFRPRLIKASLVIGPAMVPRGEVALVVVNIGFALGFFDPKLLNVLLVTVVLTTFIGPIGFKLALGRWLD